MLTKAFNEKIYFIFRSHYIQPFLKENHSNLYLLDNKIGKISGRERFFLISSFFIRIQLLNIQEEKKCDKRSL